MNPIVRRQSLLLSILILGAGGLQAAGEMTTYVTRASFGGDTVLDWGALGPTAGPGSAFGTIFNDLPSSFPGVTVSGSSASLLARVDEDINYFGNFAPRDRLIMTTAVAARGQVGRAPGPIRFAFSGQPVSGAGLQISTSVPGPFIATLKAFDATGTLLTTASVAGVSINLTIGDNSAPFLGIRSSLQEIAAVEVNVPGVTGVTVNSMSIALGAAATVPVTQPPPPPPATGKISVYTTETLATLFGGDASVDWAGLGDGGGGQLVIGNFNDLASSVPTLSVSGSSATSDLTRVDQGIDYFGNFAPGDKLLMTSSVPPRGEIPSAFGPMRLTFNAPVFGAGMQISTNVPGPFTATLKAFNATGDLVGIVKSQGMSTVNTTGDNTAPFLGIRSTLGEIVAVEIDIPGVTGVTVNRLLVALKASAAQ